MRASARVRGLKNSSEGAALLGQGEAPLAVEIKMVAEKKIELPPTQTLFLVRQAFHFGDHRWWQKGSFREGSNLEISQVN